MLADVDRIIMPGITHWQSPGFFAFFPSNASAPSILGELLSAGLGVQGMLWLTSPACTELETHVLDWVVEMLDLPAAFRSSGAGGGVIQDTASSATLCALLAARERATSFASNARGVPAGLVVYASSQAHSSVEKDVKIAGLGRESLRLIDVDGSFAMRPDTLEAAIRTDLAAGRTPCFACATVGTTSAGAIDPLPAIAEICRRHGIWLHVDGAMAGTAAVCPELRFVHDGLEAADSYCFNPHKWMFTNFDCDCFWVADRAALIRTLSILPAYLENAPTASGAVIDYRDWHVPLGRRFRALKLWFVIRHYGVEGLRHHVREHVRLARLFTEWVRADDRFELALDPPLNLVCFRHRGGDAINQAIVDGVNATGKMYLTSTKLGGHLTLRMSIGQAETEDRHVRQAWALIIEAAGDHPASGRAPEPGGRGRA
jgi:aromatic-L-amino-acid decarboxylase